MVILYCHFYLIMSASWDCTLFIESLVIDIWWHEFCLDIVYNICYWILQALLASHLLPMAVFPRQDCVMESVSGIQIVYLALRRLCFYVRASRQGSESYWVSLCVPNQMMFTLLV